MKSTTIIALCAILLALGVSAEAQSNKIPRIGFVAAALRSTLPARIEAFRQRLRDPGCAEDKNVVIEWRFA
jgi:hypothetical protein